MQFVGKGAAAGSETLSFLAGNFKVFQSNDGFCGFVRFECNFNKLLCSSVISFTYKIIV